MSDPNMVPETFEAARGAVRLRPVGSTALTARRLWLENMGGTARSSDAVVSITDDVLVGAYLDLPAADVPVSWATLEDWGVPVDAVIGEGLRNADAAGAAPLQQLGDAWYLDDRPTAAAYLLRPDATRALIAGVPQPLVFAPTHQHLVFADLRSPASVEGALRLSLESLEADGTRPVSRTTLMTTSIGWEPIILADSPLSREFRHLFDAGRYAEARDIIRAANDRLGVSDVILPAYQVHRAPAGHTTSITSLTDTADLRTFLPMADEVVLVRDEGATAVPMQRLLEVEGLTTPVAGLLPPYVAVDRFPTELL